MDVSDSTDNHHWLGEIPDPEKYYGFIYIITNLLNGRRYIGRKFYHRYRKRKPIGQTNWRNYMGSSSELLGDIHRFGKDSFIFEIVRQLETRGGLVYTEVHLQHYFNVLTDTFECGTPKWYNKNIGSVKFVPKEFLSEEHKRKISEAHFGKRASEETRLLLSQIHTERLKDPKNHSMYGRKHSLVARKRMSESAKGKRSGTKNPSADLRTYKFLNTNTDEEFIGTRCDFAEKCNISKFNVTTLVNGKTKKNRAGWVLIEEI